MKGRKATAPILCQCETCIAQTYDTPSGDPHPGLLWAERAFRDHSRELKATARAKDFVRHLQPSPESDGSPERKHHRTTTSSRPDPHANLDRDLVALQLKSDGDRLKCGGDVLAGFEIAEIRFLNAPEAGSAPLDTTVPFTDPRLQLDVSHKDSQQIQGFEAWLLNVDSLATDNAQSHNAGRRVLAENNRRLLKQLFPQLADLKQRAYNHQLETNPVYTGEFSCLCILQVLIIFSRLLSAVQL